MSDLRLPCAEGNGDDWFVSRDGRQYPSDDLLTDIVRDAIAAEADRQGLDGEERVAFIEKTTDMAEGDARRDALRRRRHARDACHTDCLFRTRCLDMVLEGDFQHGTWGGYYEEEIRELRRELRRRETT